MIFPRKYTSKEQDIILSKLVIDVDSREKSNIHITSILDLSNIQYKTSTLNFADYTFHIPPIPELDIHEEISFANHISIERKNSLNEMAGNITKDRERFKREFERHEGLMILMIECDTYADIFKQNYKSKLLPQSFIGTLHKWQHKYGVPFIFIDKEYAGRYIYFTFYYYLKYILEGGG